MNGTDEPMFIPVEQLARRLGLPAAWLKEEGEAHRIPRHVVADKFVYNVEAVANSLRVRMQEATEGNGQPILPPDTVLGNSLEDQPWQVLFHNYGSPFARSGGLPARIIRGFAHADIHTVGDLCAHTKGEIRSLPEIGDTCFGAIKKAVAEAGLSFQ